MADDFIGVREHHEAVGALKDELARQREKTAGLEMSLLHQMSGMQRSLEDIKSLLQRPTSTDHAALAAHRAIDTLPQAMAQAIAPALQGANKSPSSILLAFALLGAITMGAVGMHFIGG